MPVRGKWGRVNVNLTVAKEIDKFWVRKNVLEIHSLSIHFSDGHEYLSSR
jgi:hypothetical protein